MIEQERSNKPTLEFHVVGKQNDISHSIHSSDAVIHWDIILI